MPWLQLVLDIPQARAEFYEDCLLTLGACSVTYRDAADQPLFEPGPGEIALWDHLQLVGLFTDDFTELQLRPQLAALLLDEPLPPLQFEILEDQIWERSWIEHFQPMLFGERLWIYPSWADAPTSGAILRLDPGLAFGTGTHPTTALCLEWLDGQALAGKTVIDYGCGSGILAIAALILDAASVLAVDNDPQALQATQSNAQQNHCAERLRIQSVSTAGEPLREQADIVIANILAGPLCTLAHFIEPLVKPGGQLVLSGILADQAEQVMAAYQPRIHFDPPAVRDGWVRLNGQACLNDCRG